MNKCELNKYYRDICKQLVCSKKEKKQIIERIKESIDCFLAENPNADINVVYENFGTAKEIADENINNENAEILRAKINRRKAMFFIVIIALVFTLLIYIAAIMSIVIENHRSANGYDVVNISEISNSDISSTSISE